MRKAQPPKTPAFNARQWTSGALTNLDPALYKGFTRQELAGVVRTLADVANKRLTRLQRKGIQSPAAFDRQNEGYIPRFSTKGKSLKELQSEYARVKSFLTAETSTVKGVTQWKEKSIEELKQSGVNVSQGTFDTFWKVYEKLKQLDKSVAEKGLKYKVLETLQKEMKARQMTDGSSDKEIEDLAMYMSTQVQKIYESWQEQENELPSINDLFRRQVERRNKNGGFGKNY